MVLTWWSDSHLPIYRIVPELRMPELSFTLHIFRNVLCSLPNVRNALSMSQQLAHLLFIENEERISLMFMFNILQPLLSLNNGRARLAVSSLVYTYCQQHNCIEHTEVTTILAALEGGIKDGCYVNEDNLQLVYYFWFSRVSSDFKSSLTLALYTLSLFLSL